MSAIPAGAVEHHLAILGKTGSGKSYAAKGVVEAILDEGGRVCVIDPTGVWAGLRTNAAGDGPGYPIVILGGKNGDVGIGKTEGAAVARAVGTSSTSFVIDMLTLSHGAKVQFFRDFAHSLLSENEGVLHLVIDEAHDFAPQSGGMRDPAAADMLHAANNLVAQGRARGLRIMLLTQRPAKLHKDALTQVEAIVAMRVTAPQDRKPIEDWMVGFYGPAAARDVAGALAGLKTGEGFIAANGAAPELVAFPRIKTFDTGRPGAHVQRPLAPVDVEALRTALAAPTGDKSEAKGKRERGASEAEIAAAERRGYERGFRDGVAAGRAQTVELVRSATDALESTLKRCVSGDVVTPSAPAVRLAAVAKPAPQPDPKPTPKRQPVGQSGFLNSAGRKLLAVLDTNPPVRRTWQQAATLAGLKARGGHFNAGRKALLDSELVIEEGGLIRVAQPSVDAAATGSDPAVLVEMWAGVMSGAAPKLLRQIYVEGGRASRAMIADHLGMKPTGGHWNAGWKELRDNGIVMVSGDVAELTELFQP